MNLQDFPELIRAAPGALGSLVSMLWLKETEWLRRAILFVGGSGFSYGATPWVAMRTNLENGFFLAFVLGLGSMAFFSKCFETLQDFALAKWFNALLYRYTGVTPKD
jgi:hypothetical protein